MFKKLALESTPIGDINFSNADAVNYISTSPLLMEIGDSVPNKPAYMIYISEFEVFVDSTDPGDLLKCYNGPCVNEILLEEEEKSEYYIRQGSYGGTGEPGPSGSVSSADPEANFPNGTGTTGWKRRLNVEEISNNSSNIKIYPNPARDIINLTMSAQELSEINIAIIDVNGKVVNVSNYSVNSGDNTIKIDISNLTEGIYILRLRHNNEMTAIQFIKE